MSRIENELVSAPEGVARVLGAGGCVGVAPLPEGVDTFKKLRVLVNAYGDMTSASARIRTWNRLASISDKVDVDIYSGNAGEVENADVVYLQKRANPVTFDLVNTAHAAGKKVVFDIDDHIGCSASEHLNKEMLCKADAIVVDTRFKRDEFSQYTSRPIEIIPDGIDYFTEWFDVKVENKVESVCTFGWDHNVKAAIPAMLELSKKYKTACISNKPIPECEFIPWELPSFIDNLKRFDCAYLAHGDHPNDRLRCCNRLLTALFCGLVTVVRDTPEYRETLAELDATSLISSGPHSVAYQVSRLAEVRVPMLATIRPMIWERYRPEVGGEKLFKILEAHRA